MHNDRDTFMQRSNETGRHQSTDKHSIDTIIVPIKDDIVVEN